MGPYGNVDDLPVAVVNQDKSSTLNDQTLSIGDDMLDSMSKNKALDYHFVSAEKAEEGLEMVITIWLSHCQRIYLKRQLAF